MPGELQALVCQAGACQRELAGRCAADSPVRQLEGRARVREGVKAPCGGVLCADGHLDLVLLVVFAAGKNSGERVCH